MSEKDTPESVAARLYRYCKREYDCPHPSVDDVEAELAAAEERGRRRGVEEAITVASGFGTFGQGLVKQLRTLLREDAEPPKKATIAELEAILVLPDDALEVYVLPNGEVRARPRIALAPRDSGKDGQR